MPDAAAGAKRETPKGTVDIAQCSEIRTDAGIIYLTAPDVKRGGMRTCAIVLFCARVILAEGTN